MEGGIQKLYKRFVLALFLKLIIKNERRNTISFKNRFPCQIFKISETSFLPGGVYIGRIIIIK
jgi:hypothetical protein